MNKMTKAWQTEQRVNKNDASILPDSLQKKFILKLCLLHFQTLSNE